MKPPASTYCRAIALSEPQWVESSYFAPRSSTSALQRFTASCSLFAIGSSFDSLEEHPATKSGIRRSGAIRLLRIIFFTLGDEARAQCALLATRGADETFRPGCGAQLSLSP